MKKKFYFLMIILIIMLGNLLVNLKKNLTTTLLQQEKLFKEELNLKINFISDDFESDFEIITEKNNISKLYFDNNINNVLKNKETIKKHILEEVYLSYGVLLGHKYVDSNIEFSIFKDNRAKHWSDLFYLKYKTMEENKKEYEIFYDNKELFVVVINKFNNKNLISIYKMKKMIELLQDISKEKNDERFFVIDSYKNIIFDSFYEYTGLNEKDLRKKMPVIFNDDIYKNGLKQEITKSNYILGDNKKRISFAWSTINLKNKEYYIGMILNPIELRIIINEFLRNNILIMLLFIIITIILILEIIPLLKKKKLSKIKKERKMFEIAIDGVKDGLWEWDLRTNEIVCSDRWYEMFGYKVSFFDNKDKVLKLIHKDDIEQFLEESNNHRNGESEYFSSEHRVKCKDGTYKWVLSRGKLNYDKNENFKKLVGFSTDINQMKKMEYELIKLNKKIYNEKSFFKGLIDTIPDLIFLKNREGIYIQCNKAFSEFIGLSEFEIIGKNDYDLYSQETASLYRDLDKYILRKKKRVQRETKVIQLNKNISTLDLIKAPYYSCESEFMGIIGIARDATKRKKESEELKLAKLESEIANKAKSQFLANMSHEIRTPMNGIIGFIDILKETELSETQQDYIDSIDYSSELLLNIINDILDISKIEANKVTLMNEEVNLIEILRNIINLFNGKAILKNIKLNFEFDDEINYIVNTDQVRIKQIIANLVNNAIKFTDEGKVEVRVKEINKKNEEVLIQIEIEDTGIGISKSKIKTIFYPFEQDDISIEKRFQGTGLGLTIAKNLIELLKGSINVESELGIGSKFIIKIPFQIKKYEDDIIENKKIVYEF